MDSRIKILMVVAGLALSAVVLISTAKGTGLGQRTVGDMGTGLIHDVIWLAKRLLYISYATGYGTEGLDELTENIAGIVMMNPSVDDLSNLMTKIMTLVFTLYVPTIAFLGFYILFLSSSPEGRADAKSMFTKMIIGLIFVSISPQLLSLLLTVSEGLTSSILATTEQSVFVGAWDTTIGKSAPPSGLKGLHAMATIIEVELGFFTFLFYMLLVWGAFIFPIVIRFFAVSTFMVLFPLSILFYSFEFSKTLGKAMLEQTLIWIFLQVINALIVLTIVQSIIGLGADFMVVGLRPAGISFFVIPVVSFVGCLMFTIAPLFIIRFFKGFLP